MKKDIFKRMEVCGVIFTLLCGTLLYFCYDLSSHAAWSILVASINHSAWETIKVFIVPYIFWAIVEICILRLPMKKILISKTLGIYIFCVLAILMYYIYFWFFGNPFFITNMIAILLCLILSYIISYRLIQSKRDLSNFFTIGAFGLILLIAMYLSFSINPPHAAIFKDPISGLYGILPKNVLPSWINF